MRSYIKPCMGGRCKLRGQCAHHEIPDNRETDDDPAERLCDPGREREMFFRQSTKNEERQQTHNSGLV